MEDETPPNTQTGTGSNDNFFTALLKRVTDFFSIFGTPRTEVPYAAVAEEVKIIKREQKRQEKQAEASRKSEILIQQKLLKKEEQELRKSDIRSKLNRGGDPSSRMWIEFIISCGYDEEARKKELLEEQLLYHATEKLSRIGTQESKIEMEQLMCENALKKEESQIIRSLWKLKYQMWDLCQFYHILRFECKRFDTYKVQVEEYVSKDIEDAMILGKRMRDFCSDPNNTRDSAEIFQPETLERLKDNLVAYYYQLKVMMCNTPTKEYKAAFRDLEESIWGLQKIEWNNKTKEWMLDASKKANKKKKQLKLKKQPAVEIDENESNEGEIEPIIKEMEQETVSSEPDEPTAYGSHVPR